VEDPIKNQKSKIIHLHDCAEFIAGDGSILRELLHPDKADVKIRYSLAQATVKPGEKTKAHRLRTTEVYYILAGHGCMHLGDETAAVGPESTVYIPPHSLQHIENIGDNNLVFLCIVDPAWRQDDEEVMKEESPRRLAVDVALLPDEAMTRQAIELNRQLVTDGPQEIPLSREDRLPHISLAMGCLDEADLPAMQKRLENLAQKTTVRQLRIVDLISSVNSRGETTSLLEVERTPQLQALHEEVMQAMEPCFRYEPTEAMISDDVVSPSCLDWIRTYRQKSSYEHFLPHLTLGYGRVPPGLSFPMPFTAARLALCHLGNHCTCRRIIGAWNIG
jgi:mannose-6-phosphate isomerase-like protein (cupin superfamily)